MLERELRAHAAAGTSADFRHSELWLKDPTLYVRNAVPWKGIDYCGSI
jgi:hypothetical protein